MLRKSLVLALIFAVLVGAPAAAQGPSAVSAGNVVELQVGTQRIAVNLISQGQDVTGINVAGVDMGALVGVETSDPQQRYLPNVAIVPKTEGRTLTLRLVQVPGTVRFRFRPIGDANVAPFLAGFIGTAAPDKIHTLLAAQYPAGVNMLLPVEASADVALYRTPLAATVVAVPAALVPNPQALPGPGQALAVPSVALIHVADLTQSPYTYLQSAQTAAAPNLVGVTAIPGLGLDPALELATAPLGFRYAITPISCPNQFGVVTAQEPAPGAQLNPFTSTLKLTVCEEFAKLTGRVNVANVNVRRVPVVVASTIVRAVRRGTVLTATGRTASKTWLRVVLADGTEGWVTTQAVQLDGNLDQLQVVDVLVAAFLADRTSLTAGQCVTITWRTENAATVLYKGARANASGTARECPRQATTYALRVTGSDGQSFNLAVRIQVRRAGY